MSVRVRLDNNPLDIHQPRRTLLSSLGQRVMAEDGAPAKDIPRWIRIDAPEKMNAERETSSSIVLSRISETVFPGQNAQSLTLSSRAATPTRSSNHLSASVASIPQPFLAAPKPSSMPAPKKDEQKKEEPKKAKRMIRRESAYDESTKPRVRARSPFAAAGASTLKA